MKKIMLVFGTRPEAIKMAPLYLELKKQRHYKVLCTVTAQHRDMLDSILDTFGMSPDYDLDIMKKEQSISDITNRILKGMEPILANEKPDLLLVHGDTSTAFVSALAGFYQKIPVGHVEAGLRSFDNYSPYPEEMNRKLISSIAKYHYAPTIKNKEYLLAEGLSKENIFVTGNTVIDALAIAASKNISHGLKGVDFDKNRVILLTCHRRESLGDEMRAIFSSIKAILDEYKDIEVVYPIHKNPKVREIFEQTGITSSRMHLIEPLEYLPFVTAMNSCHMIVTDSGGIQEEAPYFGKPVIVVRNVTERMEAVESGTVKLVGTKEENIRKTIKALLDDSSAYEAMANAVNPYGDGKASKRIIEAIDYSFGQTTTRPEGYV